MLSPEAHAAILLTLRLAASTSVLLLLLATPLAWWLAYTRTRWRPLVMACVTLPLVLPPSVLGFYLLMGLGPHGWLGQVTQALGWGLLSFHFSGLLLGSMVFSLPFAVHPLVQAFEAIGQEPLEVASTLGAGPIRIFWCIGLPLAKPGLFTAALLSFSHTVGEFGVALMVGGNIPGQTRVISTQLYSHVEAMEYTAAHHLAAGLVLFSFVVLLLWSWLQQRALKSAKS